MRSVPILLLFGFFVVLIQSRPSKTDENDESDSEVVEYGGEDRAAEDSTGDSVKQNDDASERDMDQSRIMDVKKNMYSYEQRNLAESRADRSHSDISDYKPYGNRDVRKDKPEETNNYEDIQNYAKRRPSKYIENKETADQQEAAQHLTNRNFNYYKNSRIHNNMLLEDPLSKRETSLKETPTEQGKMLFETRDQASQVDKNYFSNEPLELNQRYSKYHTQIYPENKELIQCKSRESDLYFNRDRRETKDLSVDTMSKAEEQELDKNQNEDEEMAIKRHIKKLSADELEELLSSLSEEKRQLLQTIIDDTDLTVNENVNKREITKKAGAVEENTCVESGPVDSGILSGITAVDASTEAHAQSSDTTEASKQTDNQSESTDLSNSKSTETSSGNKAGLISQNQDAVQQKSDAEASNISAEISPAEIISSEQVTTKTENKRETNLDDLADIVSFEDSKIMENDWLTGDSKDQQGYVCSQDEDLSQFLDDEQAMANDGSKIYKRDAEKKADYDAKMKSLEESFPKSTNYDKTSGPLIRMKRTNEPVMKKRSAAILPDAKVAFFPYRTENEDEDTDEGNEFDDDGFYDRSPNFSSEEANMFRIASSCKLNDGNRHASSNDNISKGTMSLGSDTDSVLSGVEGVDENLMFSSGSRNRRTTDDVSDVLDESNSIHNSKSLSETKAVPDMNALTYQESDSFGPLPRNNEGESGRYKRIRRVKQSHPEGASSDSYIYTKT